MFKSFPVNKRNEAPHSSGISESSTGFVLYLCMLKIYLYSHSPWIGVQFNLSLSKLVFQLQIGKFFFNLKMLLIVFFSMGIFYKILWTYHEQVTQKLNTYLFVTFHEIISRVNIQVFFPKKSESKCLYIPRYQSLDYDS